MDILKIIEEKILENSSVAQYSRIAIRDVTAGNPTVGIWWYVRGKVLKLEDTVENCEDSDMICVSQEHSKTFPFLQKQYATTIPELLTVRFNQIERGRVWAVKDPERPGRFHYLITCSTSISRDCVAIAAIKSSFGISGKTVQVQAQPGMYDREILIR